MNQEWQTLFAHPDDDLLVMTIWGCIEERMESVVVPDLPVAQRHVQLALRLAVACDSEGITGFLWQAQELLWPETMDALRVLDMNEEAAELAAIGTWFDAEMPPEDLGEREQVLERLSEAQRDEMDGCATEIWWGGVMPKVAEFVRREPEAFVDLPEPESWPVDLPWPSIDAPVAQVLDWLRAMGARLGFDSHHYDHGARRQFYAMDELPDQPGQLRDLELPGSRRDLDAVLEHLASWSGASALETLELMQSVHLTERGLRALHRWAHLEEVDLMLSLVSDLALRELLGCTGLTKLGLRSTQVSDETLRILGDALPLRSLDLDRTRITDAGFGHWPALEELNLGECHS